MPSINDITLRERLASLTPEAMERLLDSLLREAPDETPEGAAGKDTFRATAAQSIFWTHYILNPSGADNHQLLSFRIQGDIDLQAMRTAWELLSAKHPSLRTVFFEDDGLLHQRIFTQLPIPFEYLGAERTGSYFTPTPEETKEYFCRPFDLRQEPPIRARLCQCGDRQYQLYIVLHHIAFDGRSKVVLLEGLSQCYRLALSKQWPTPKEHGISIGDISEREYAWLAGEEASKSLAYWMARPFQEGVQHPWPQHRQWESQDGTIPDATGTIPFDFGPELSEKIRKAASERGMTVLQWLIGCYAISLHRLLSIDVATIGIPVDSRRTLEERSLIGCLMNVVPVVLEAGSFSTSDEYLESAAGRIKEAIEHASIPLHSILENSYLDSSSERTFHWKTIVNFKEDYSGTLSLTGCSVETLPYVDSDRSADLSLTFLGQNTRSVAETIHVNLQIHTPGIQAQDTLALLHTWRSVAR